MNKELAIQFGTYNRAKYPSTIQLITTCHQIVSYRKVKKLIQRKVILAFPKCEILKDFSQSISAEDVDPYYDLILFFSSNGRDQILQRSKISYVEENFESAEKKNKRILSAPKGLQVRLEQDFEKEVYSCLLSWFSNDEVYWL